MIGRTNSNNYNADQVNRAQQRELDIMLNSRPNMQSGKSRVGFVAFCCCCCKPIWRSCSCCCCCCGCHLDKHRVVANEYKILSVFLFGVSTGNGVECEEATASVFLWCRHNKLHAN